MYLQEASGRQGCLFCWLQDPAPPGVYNALQGCINLYGCNLGKVIKFVCTSSGLIDHSSNIKIFLCMQVQTKDDYSPEQAMSKALDNLMNEIQAIKQSFEVHSLPQEVLCVCQK